MPTPARRLRLLAATLCQFLVHDFVLLFLPPYGPSTTGSLEPGQLVYPLLGGHTSIDLSHVFFMFTNTNQATTCTYNTRPVSPHHVVNHSSLRSDHPSVLKPHKSSISMLTSIELTDIFCSAHRNNSLVISDINRNMVQEKKNRIMKHIKQIIHYWNCYI
jgi:hypothetical protein